MKIYSMAARLIYFFLLIVLAWTVNSCSKSEEGKSDEVEEASPEDKEEVKEIVEEFFFSLFSGDLDGCKKHATKASYSSLNFLNKVFSDFESCYFSNVVSCEIEGKKAICTCEFGYYGESMIQRDVIVEKYNDEWLIDFQLGNNFENIFMYDYGFSLNSREGDESEQISLDDVIKKELSDVIDRLTSSQIKIGFSSSTDVFQVDSAYYGSSTFGESEWSSDDFTISTTYDFEGGKLDYCTVEIDKHSYPTNLQGYAHGVAELVREKLGEPFNVPEEHLDNLEDIYESRWFIKGYNEVLTLRISSGYFAITIFEIP